MTKVTTQEVLKKLAEWAEEPHDVGCSGIVCRHARAKQAIVEVGNAIADVEWRKKKCPECKGGGEIGLADGDVACPTCGGSGDETDPGPFKQYRKAPEIMQQYGCTGKENDPQYLKDVLVRVEALMRSYKRLLDEAVARTQA